MRWLLAPFRAIVFSAHVLLGVAIVLVIFLRGQISAHINRRWSRVLIALCGARVVVSGVAVPLQLQRDGIDPTRTGRLALPITSRGWTFSRSMRSCRAALSRSQRSGVAVAWCAGIGRRHVVHRARAAHVAAMNKTVREHLKLGETIVVFAEGTTTDGSGLLPFHSNVIAPALDGTAIWPIDSLYRTRQALIGRRLHR